MDLRLMLPGQEPVVIDLVKQVFYRFVAPGFSRQGIAEFYKFANADSLCDRSKKGQFTVMAMENREVLGILEIRDLEHISMFFVLEDQQKKGIGRALLMDAIRRIREARDDLEVLTVNSSPNAVAAYQAFGFIKKDEEQCVNGIRFVPMQLDPAAVKND